MTLSGFFCIDKPSGMTSHNVISRMRKILNMKKVGHSGTLDPMATGVLIVACGTSTRLLDYVQSGTKEYIADVVFGVKTSTGDFEGEVIDEKDMTSLTLSELEKVIPNFVGEIEQIPPMVSAIKVDGKKLYEYQREGIEIERKSRKVTIESIEIESFDNGSSAPKVRLRITCSAGTYIRTRAEDIAEKLNGFAHLIALRRTRNGNIDEYSLVKLDDLEALDDPASKLLTPIDVLGHMHQIELDEEQCKTVSFGQPLKLNDIQKQHLIHNNVQEFVAIGKLPRNLVAIYINEANKLKSKCIVFLD